MHGRHRARFHGVGMVEVSNGVFGVSELGGSLPFPFLSREPLLVHQVLEVVSAKARVENLLNLLLFETFD